MKFYRFLVAICVLLLCHIAWTKEDKQECDRELIAETLGKRLKISLRGSTESSAQLWNESALVCKKRPDYPQQIIVATLAESKKPPEP